MIKVYESSKKGLGGGNFLRYEHDHTSLTLLELYHIARSKDGVELEAEKPERYFLAALKQYEERLVKPRGREYLSHLLRRSGEYGSLLNYIQWLEAITGVK